MPPGGNRDIDVPPIPIVAVCTGIFHAQGSRSGGTARSTMRQTRRGFHATLFGYRSPCSFHARFLPLPRPRRWPPLHSTKVWEVQMLLRRSGSCQSKQFCLEMLRGIKPLRIKHLWSACSSFSAHKGLPAKTRRIHGGVGVFLFSVLRCGPGSSAFWKMEVFSAKTPLTPLSLLPP